MLLDKLQIALPIIQAPMAGVSTPALAAAVSNAGALGSIGVGAADAAGTRAMIAELQALTPRAFNVNFFVHQPGVANPAVDARWLAWLAPLFAEFGAEPPATLRPTSTSFAEDPALLALALELKPAVISFHFGLPSADAVRALKAAGTVLLASVTSADEARRAEQAGMDALVAQGIEAGGHRGVFDPAAPDAGLGTFALTRLLVRSCNLPIIAAGGIMDGAGIAAALKLGAAAAQLGTAFVACPESSADAAYREALRGPGAYRTRLTRLISGRPARSLGNRFTALADNAGLPPTPAYPLAYAAGKALNAAARERGEFGFGAHWAGQGAPLARALPAAELVAALAQELLAALSQGAAL